MDPSWDPDPDYSAHASYYRLPLMDINDDYFYDSNLLAWEHKYEESASFSSDCRVMTCDQFLALAAGALVPRCGAASPVRHLPCPVLMDLRAHWVMRVAREVGCTLRVACAQPVNRDALVHVFLGLSASGGVVRADCCLLSPEASQGRGLHLRGSLGHGRFLAARLGTGGVGGVTRYYVVDWGGDVAVADFHATNDPAVCSSGWIVFLGRKSLLVWKVVGGELWGNKEVTDLPYTLYAGFGGGATFEGVNDSGSNTLVIMAAGGGRGRPCVIFVDLEQTFADGLLTVVRYVEVPEVGFGASGFLSDSGSCMCVGDDVFTVFSTETEHIICDIGTGKTTLFTRPCFLEIVGKEHVCRHRDDGTLFIYHVPGIMDYNPCMSFTSFGALESNPRLGTRTGIVAIPAVPYTAPPERQVAPPVPEEGTAISVLTGLFDVTTGMKIGVVEVKWVKSGGKPTPPKKT